MGVKVRDAERECFIAGFIAAARQSIPETPPSDERLRADAEVAYTVWCNSDTSDFPVDFDPEAGVFGLPDD